MVRPLFLLPLAILDFVLLALGFLLLSEQLLKNIIGLLWIQDIAKSFKERLDLAVLALVSKTDGRLSLMVSQEVVKLDILLQKLEDLNSISLGDVMEDRVTITVNH